MPVQIWSSGQQLTAAELTSVTNMLPFMATAGGNVNPCVAGTFYRCTGGAGQVMTLPGASNGSVIGFVVDEATGGSPVTINGGGGNILSPRQPNRSQTSITLPAADSYIVLNCDGTNWHEVASGGTVAGGLLANVSTPGGPGITSSVSPGVQITSATATLTVLAGRTLQVTWAGTLSASVSANGAVLITKGGAAFPSTVRNNYVVGGQYATTITQLVDSPAAGSVTYAANAYVSTGTLTPVLGLFTVQDVT